VIGGARLAVCFGIGVLTAFVLTSCGGSGVSNSASTSIKGASGDRATATQTPTGTQQTSTRPSATVTETRPGVTITSSETVGVTVTPAAQATSSETSGWIWVIIAAVGAAVIALIVWFLGRRRRAEVSLEERSRSLGTTIASWTSQGWVIENQSEDSAVLGRDGERVVITVTSAGRVTSGALGSTGGPPTAGPAQKPQGPADPGSA